MKKRGKIVQNINIYPFKKCCPPHILSPQGKERKASMVSEKIQIF